MTKYPIGWSRTLRECVIETGICTCRSEWRPELALCVMQWIETTASTSWYLRDDVCTLRECVDWNSSDASNPMKPAAESHLRERRLKLDFYKGSVDVTTSHSAWVRWIETKQMEYLLNAADVPHSTWVRGLKHGAYRIFEVDGDSSRTLRECVDWDIYRNLWLNAI